MTLDIYSFSFILLFLLLIQGIFEGSEIALMSADKLKLRKAQKKGSYGAKLALKLIKEPSKILSTILLVTVSCVAAISALVELYFNQQGIQYPLASILFAVVMIIIFAELLPKALYRRHADRLAPLISRPVRWAYLLFLPATYSMSRLTKRIAKLLGPIDVMITGRTKTTRNELISILNTSRKGMEIRNSEQKMIKRILDFKDSEAKHALIPLVKVYAVDISSTIEDIFKNFDEHRHSRIPVYEDRIDNIKGILVVWDLFGVQDLKSPIARFVRPATFFSETQTLDSVFKVLSHAENQMGIVVDEHGGATGILTFEDIVEEIVGEIRDEDDSEVSAIRMLKPDKWLLQAQVDIEQINEEIKIGIPEGEYETLAGFLLQEFGRIPSSGETIEYQNVNGIWRFTIREASERRIVWVLVEYEMPPSD